MSWSIALIGKPDNIVERLTRTSMEMTEGQSKTEYDEALPHLIGIVKQNFALSSSGYTEPMVKLEANGSGFMKDGLQQQRSLKVTIESMYITVV